MSTILELEEKNLPENCFVFKHSTACPISFAAADQVKAASFSLPLYWINVREQRDLSNWVESHYEVEHESPQLIYIKDGKAESSCSHRQVTKEAFNELQKAR